MDCGKVGALLCALRREQGMTQRQVAARLNVSDKAVSKWERGMGCPDVNLLGELGALFGVNIEQILEGEIAQNRRDTGNMLRTRFYVCPCCGNVMHTTGKADITCCGRRLTALEPKPADAAHMAAATDTDGGCYITFAHEMTKQHFISFVACIANDRLLLVKLYPEQEAAVILPGERSALLLRRQGHRLYYCCSAHGLYRL